MTDSPILLFGMPRSGTTWVGKIFDSHPLTLYRHEPDSVERLPLPLLPPPQAEEYCAEIQNALQRYGQMNHPKVCAKLPLFPKRYLSPLGLFAFKAGVYFTKAAGRLASVTSVPAAPRWQPGPSGMRLVWKSIESLGRLGLLHRCLAPCRIVHIVRHPCGYVASILRGEAKGKFDDRTPASEDYGILQQLLETPQAKRLGLDLPALKAMTPEERLAWRWALFNQKAHEELRGEAAYTLLVYDHLCAEPMEESRRLFQHCELEWHPQTEHFVRQSTVSEDSAYYSIFKDPLKSANKWREDLDDGQIRRILAVAERIDLGIRFSA